MTGRAGFGGRLVRDDRENQVRFACLSKRMGGYGDGRARELTSALRHVVRA